jgi:hypothetical protein
MTCDGCNRVLNQPTTIGPTTSLVLRSARLGNNGAVEIYKCERCGTQWHRFKPDMTFKGKPPTWLIVRNSRLRD